ncbi:MAG: hypothetical protein AAFV54_10260 [Pseudomonadota bacterium]
MYDARKYSGGGSLKDGMAFGLFVMLAALVSFLLAYNAPEMFGDSGDQSAKILEANTNGRLTLPDIDTKRLDAALKAYDADLHSTTTAKLASMTDVSIEAMGETIVTEIGLAVATDQESFARMPIRHLNEVITLSRDRLRRAVSRRNPWCAGSAYKDIMGAGTQAELTLVSDRMSRDIAGANAALAQYFADVGAIFLEGAVAARRSPTQLGPVTEQDEAALQGMVMSLVTDEQLIPVMVAAQQGDVDETLDKLNVCSLGVTVVTAVRTLPEETKGRVWSGMMLGEFNPSTIN